MSISPSLEEAAREGLGFSSTDDCLFWFGSGPIRGFAVVLVIGLITSVFTAVFLTKMWVSGYLSSKRPRDLTI